MPGKRFLQPYNIQLSLVIPLALIPWVSLSGCATAPRAGAGWMPPALAASRVTLGSVPYVSAAAVARELGGQGFWDPDGMVWRLRVRSHELRLAPEMEVAMVDGTERRLPAPPRMEKGELLVPERLWADWLARWRGEPSAVAPIRGARLRTIMVDAGHGGHDPGAIGRRGLREKSVTLDIAKRLRDLLMRDGFQVLMTRSDDRFIPLYGRSAVANRAGADLFISIHANASRSRSADGFETYYLSEATDDHARALEASENARLPGDLGSSASSDTQAILWDLLYTEHRAESLELAGAICRGMSAHTSRSKNRGVKSARFAVLKGTRMPAVLVEVGFITHAGEEAELRSSDYRQRVAEGIRRGILSFRSELERSVADAGS